MPTEKKIERVGELEEKLRKATIAISTEFRGLTVAQMSDLRRKLRATKVEAVVVKNTLAGIAGEKAGKPKLREILKGPSVVVLGYGDVTAPARAITEHIRATKVGLTVMGAVMDGQVLTAAEVQGLATVPPKPVLVAQVMGNLLAPLSGLVYSLTYHIGGLARVLDAHYKQLEKAASPGPADAPAPSPPGPADAPPSGGPAAAGAAAPA